MNRLVEVRKALRFKTQSEFAKALDVNSSYISVVESGKRELRRSLIDKICAAFPQVNRDYLVSGVGEPVISTSQSSTTDIEVAMSVIAERITRLDPDLRAEIYELCTRILATRD